MKKTIIGAALVMGLAACEGGTGGNTTAGNGAAASDAQETTDYNAVARRVVRESAGVKPGEVVVISGSPSETGLLEALQAEVQLAGGSPIVTISFPKADKRALVESPIEYLRLPPKGQLALVDDGDVFISASSVEDPGLYADADETRLSTVRQANEAFVQASSAKRGRSVEIGQTGGIPTEAYAKSQNADYRQMRDIFFRALAVPAADIAKRGAVVSQKMQPGQQVQLRSAAGTDLTFRLAAGKSRVSTGRASDNDTGKGMAAAFLPAGDFYACVDPKSANGVVVTAAGMFRGKPTRNVRMTFKDGALTSVTADDGGEALNKFFATLDAPSKQMSLINIGLNPESRPLEASRYLSWEMGGVPTVLMGNSQWAGCAQGGQAGYSIYQGGATLAAGNVEVVKGGALVLD